MRNLTKRRAEVEADSSDLIATPTRTTTGISRGMVFTCSSYPASEERRQDRHAQAARHHGQNRRIVRGRDLNALCVRRQQLFGILLLTGDKRLLQEPVDGNAFLFPMKLRWHDRNERNARKGYPLEALGAGLVHERKLNLTLLKQRRHLIAADGHIYLDIGVKRLELLQKLGQRRALQCSQSSRG